MSNRKSWFLGGLCAALLLAFVPAARADGAAAETRLREANDRIRALLRDDPTSAEIGQTIDGLLDYEGLARRALSAHWDRLTQAQKDEFLSLFRQLVAKSYRENLKDTLDNIAIDFLGWEMTPGGSVLVNTRVRKVQTRRNRRAETLITYELHQVDGAWKAIDVVTDDVHLVDSYRDMFNTIIGGAPNFDQGWADLIAKMRRKLEE